MPQDATSLNLRRECRQSGEQTVVRGRLLTMSFMVNERLRAAIARDNSSRFPQVVPNSPNWALSGTKNAHPVIHLGRDAIVAEHGFRIAQTNRFALDNKAPKRVARFGDQPGAGRVLLAAIAAFVLGERRQRLFKRAALPPECGDLFLGNLVIECRNARHSRT
jgi:hypothetical protein